MSDDLFENLFDSTEAATAVADAPAPQSSPAMPGVAESAGNMIFDCETGPVTTEILESMFVFDESKVKGAELIGQPFDPASVKLGNLKDEAKIKAKIQEKQIEYERAAADFGARVVQARTEAWAAFVEQAPLSPLTGQVLAIGYQWGEEAELDWVGPSETETDLIGRFWDKIKSGFAAGARFIGHDIYRFDLPFLVRRSWLLGVEIPPEAFTVSGGRWQWNRCFVDTMSVWSCGVYGERIALDRAAQFFGTQRKCGDGAEFHRLFNGTPEEREQALDYLVTDLEATVQIAGKMGLW